MALTCQWVEINRGHYQSRLNRTRLEVRKVPREQRRYEVIVEDILVGERTTLQGAKTAAIRIAQGGAAYNRTGSPGVGQMFRRQGGRTLSLPDRKTPVPPPPTRPSPPPRRRWPEYEDQPEPPQMEPPPSSNLPALIAEQHGDEETLTFTMRGKVIGHDMVTAINNLRAAVELLRGFAEVECSYRIPDSGKL